MASDCGDLAETLNLKTALRSSPSGWAAAGAWSCRAARARFSDRSRPPMRKWPKRSQRSSCAAAGKAAHAVFRAVPPGPRGSRLATTWRTRNTASIVTFTLLLQTFARSSFYDGRTRARTWDPLIKSQQIVSNSGSLRSAVGRLRALQSVRSGRRKEFRDTGATLANWNWPSALRF